MTKKQHSGDKSSTGKNGRPIQRKPRNGKAKDYSSASAEKVLKKLRHLEANAQKQTSKSARIHHLEFLYRAVRQWRKAERHPILMRALGESGKLSCTPGEIGAALLRAKPKRDRRLSSKYLSVIKLALKERWKLKDFAKQIEENGGINKCVELYRNKIAGRPKAH